MCPLKDAARDAPNQIAILSKERSITFSELDAYADSLTPPLLIHASPTIEFIASFFASFRKNGSIFLINPRLPQKPFLSKIPPNSLLLYTSGSTADPKIARLTLDNLIANALGAIQNLDLRPNDLWKLSLPLHHVGGLGIVVRCMLARATIVLSDHPNITHLSCVPTHLYRFTPIYKNLRCLLLGGAPLSKTPQNLPIRTTYGLTEMSSIVSIDGKVLPDRELKIEKTGEIFVKGPMLFQGYLGEKCPIWFPTGDLGKFQNGKLEILGRKDWMFISGGENIQPEEIEKELISFPEVIEAAVIPLDDPEFGKRPIAIVCAKKPFTLKQMQERLLQKLPKFKIPIALHFVNELPKKNLKLDRKSLCW